MANEITAQQLQDALGHLCDMMSEADMLQQAKGGAGLAIVNGVCDAGGNFLFSSEVVFKYAKDEYGKEHITAEVAGKIVEDLIFDYGIKQTVKATLATVATVTADTDNPIGGGVAGVFAFGAGYTLTKATAVGGGALTTKILEKVLIPSNTKKVEALAGNNQEFSLDSTAKKATIAESADVQGLTNLTLKKTNAQQLTIGTRTLDIRNLSAIELRNAVSHIDKVSFLLSEINIRVGEKLDMGSYGIYTVKGGDTLSQIAASHGMVTKDLVMLNTWLIDDGRIKFDYPTKVLVDAGTIVNSVINHTFAGTSNDDVLIDHNGGTDILIGNGGADYMDGGTGFDTYISGNGDTIKDSDGSGRVLFEGFKLSGGAAESGECKPNGDGEYKGDGGVYKLSGGTLTFTKDGTGEILTIEKFYNGDLGITLTSNDPGGSCPPPPPPREPNHNPSPNTPSPNFSSPLVFDLNGDGITSTFISETSTYFDLDNNGVRERTGWVQNTDALLVLDKNQDGVINNGTELFGNNTILSNGTKAANGFDALREYDENKDGVIDAKDGCPPTKGFLFPCVLKLA